MSKRNKSLRAAARARYRKAAADVIAPPEIATTPLPSPPPVEVGCFRLRPSDMPNSGKPEFGWGREQAATAATALPFREVDEEKRTRAVETPLTGEVRALYEDSVVPVREIARLAGVTERTIHKHARKRGWRPRVRRLDRGAGGRFIVREHANRPHATGLAALDPAFAATAAAACGAAGALAETAVAQACAEADARTARELAEKARERKEKAMRASLRTLDILAGALIDLVRQRRERPEGKIPAADRLDARLQDVILAQIGRLAAPRVPDAVQHEARSAE